MTDVQTSPLNKLRSHIMADSYRYSSLGIEGEMEDQFAPKPKWHKKGCGSLYVVLFTILGIVITCMGAYIIWFQLHRTKTCQSATCVIKGGSMLKKMNLQVDPCDDFYEYACGSWVKETVIPPEESSYTTFISIDNSIILYLQQLLSTTNEGDDSPSLQKAKLYYKTCMDIEAVNNMSTTPLLQFIKELGSWTIHTNEISGKWDESTWDLTTAIAQTSLYDYSSLMWMSIIQDDKNNTQHIIEVGQGGLTLSNRDEYIKNATKYKKAFLDFAIEYGRLLGGDTSTLTEKMTNIYEFEKNLAEIFIKKENLIDRHKTYHKMKISEFQNLLNNQIDALRYLSISTNGTEGLTSNTNILVHTPSYFKKLGQLLAKTPKETLANYVVWSAVNSLVAYLPQEFLLSAMTLSKVEFGIKDISPRWKRCVRKTVSALGYITSSVFIKEKFSEKRRAEAEKILNNVKQALIDGLQDIDFMDDQTRNNAQEKAFAVENMIGYPDWILDKQKLEDYYENITVEEGKFLQNHLVVSKEEHLRNTRKLSKKPDPKEWGMYPNQVNAYYSPTHNHIVFPAAILQPPFYDPEMPSSVQYGAIGSVIGHELTHGFDNIGRGYDKHGNLKDWWTEESATNFKTKSKCMEEQYSRFEIHNIKLNGKYTLSENIADNGGVKFAYNAFKLANEKKEIQLPGLNMTSDQLFYLGFAQAWCSKTRPESIKNKILTDVHSIKKFRVIGSLSNSPDFARAFNCPVNSGMNPENKCEVW